ncbi:MAG: 30S ribosomal protein S6 [Candidatus Gracilibacteria bacterium]|nr:30S ribosomal protein S6 [Candidatus Gracilibacteria bacterium]MDD2908631.1 30S ribosomal protein S6 [Candidatus Gracilibacteria bacterium]
MRKYELMLIINPELTDDERNNSIADIKLELTSAGVKIIGEDIWGVKDLAYKIRSSKTGYYIIYNIESDGSKFFDITKSFNIKKDIWRHMFIKIED